MTMIKLLSFLLITATCLQNLQAQNVNIAAQHWADSVYNSLSKEERIAQLMIVRLSTIDTKTKTVTFYDDKVSALIKKYNVGGICLFQGSPVRQANIINALQQQAKTPLLMCIDAEWGLGMRMIDSVQALPRQMMLGAISDSTVIYRYGQLVAAQCRRMNIQVNYAPVVDVNNNPNNPVINDRSFGEDKYKVAAFGIQYIKGMQDAGVMACAKHFPGHGDVTADSHYDLPVISKSRAQLDSLELYPFRRVFDAGVGSVMVAHLFIPAIDSTANRATSLSPKNINDLMRKELSYNGLTFTDALEMQGVKKFFPDGAASVQSLIAGNDMLCLPDDVPLAIKKIKEAIKKKKLSWDDIEIHCKKVLAAKYAYGLSALTPINTNNLTADLNAGIAEMKRTVAENAITLLAKKDEQYFPLRDSRPGETAYIGFGLTADNDFAKRIRADLNATVFYFGSNQSYDAPLLAKIKKYRKLVIGVHNTGRFPANNFGLTKDAVLMLQSLQRQQAAISFVFGNAYITKNICDAANVVLCYEDDPVIQQTAADMLEGKLPYKGTIPVSICEAYKYGAGLVTKQSNKLFESAADNFITTAAALQMDSVMANAISQHATPGGTAIALQHGKIIFEKAFGTLAYDSAGPAQMSTVYDLASLTKVLATTLSVMKLYEEGRIDLKKKLRDYLPETIGTNKGDLVIENLLLHQAGLEPTTFFFKEILDSNGDLLPAFSAAAAADSSRLTLAKDINLPANISDSFYRRILNSKLSVAGKYLYSDNDFILLAKVVERISGSRIDRYADSVFYRPMELTSLGFEPLQRNFLADIAPTENETTFRHQLLRGYVHDPGAAMFGGVAGHAGLFGNALDVAGLMQMLLNGGTFHDRRYLLPATIDLFTKYQSTVSRRGYGFDKPEKDNSARKEPYPSAYASPAAFGHTGFTGTCAWADPADDLVFVFLSNRLYPAGSNLFNRLNVRGKLLTAVYAGVRIAAAGAP